MNRIQETGSFVFGLVLATLALAASAEAAPRVLVHLSKCGGPELAADDVLVIDLRDKVQPERELQHVLEEHKLLQIRERTLDGAMTRQGTLRKIAKKAGKEHCDAVIVMRQRDAPDNQQINLGRGRDTRTAIEFPAYKVEVIFAEKKPPPPPPVDGKDG